MDSKNKNNGPVRRFKMFDDVCIYYLDTIPLPQCDRQTDGRTCRQSTISISRSADTRLKSFRQCRCLVTRSLMTSRDPSVIIYFALHSYALHWHYLRWVKITISGYWEAIHWLLLLRMWRCIHIPPQCISHIGARLLLKLCSLPQ